MTPLPSAPRVANKTGPVLWDAIFGGRPGNDFSIPNSATPTGGMAPVFPEPAVNRARPKGVPQKGCP